MALALPLPSPPTIYITVYMTPAVACFPAIDVSAIENYIFTSKQSFNANNASVSVLITTSDPAMEQGRARMTRSIKPFIVTYLFLQQMTH